MFTMPAADAIINSPITPQNIMALALSIVFSFADPLKNITQPQINTTKAIANITPMTGIMMTVRMLS